MLTLTRYCEIDYPLSIDLGQLDLKSIVDGCYENMSEKLNICTEFNPRRLKVLLRNQGMSEVRGSQIRIALPQTQKMPIKYALEMILSHEIVHYLVENHWGMMTVLWWEGLPIFLADNQVKKKLWNFDYHQLSQALNNRGELIPLKCIIRPETYYAYRHDYRVDIQAGSFIGFLYEVFGLNKLRHCFIDYMAPSVQFPQLKINSLLQMIYEKNLYQLENLWKEYLNNKKSSPPAQSFLDAHPPPKQLERKQEHCVICYAPLQQNSINCLECNAPTNLKIFLD